MSLSTSDKTSILQEPKRPQPPSDPPGGKPLCPDADLKLTARRIADPFSSGQARNLDPLLVKEFLRHKNMDSTLIYIQLEKALYQDKNENFIVMAVKDPEQIKAMLEVGFDCVCQKDDLVFLRKRK
jgi:hypothetical protein